MRWIDVDQPARRAAALSGIAAVLAGLMLAACAGPQRPSSSTAPVPGQPVPTSAIPRLTAMAERAVKGNGGRAAEWASAVVTTEEKALTSATPGDFVPGGEHTIVYLVTMKGHFTAYAASIPAGAHVPTGTYMSLVLDAKAFQGLDSGLSSKPPPVVPASLGPVTYLKVGT
jgi:hypothetical protein